MQKFELTQAEFTDLIDWMDENCYNTPLDSDDESLSGTTDGKTTFAAMAKARSKDSEELRKATRNVHGRVQIANRPAVRSRHG